NYRLKNVQKFNYFWYIPIITTVILLFTSVAYYVTLEMKQSKAIDMYEQGEELVITGEYNEAKHLFEEALQNRNNFPQAETSINFVNKAIIIMDDMEKIQALINKADYQGALTLMSEAESSLKNFQGTAV